MGASTVPTMRCARRELPPLTADFTSDFWRNLLAASLGDTRTGHSPRQATAVQTAWDADELRVLFRAEDTHVAATLTQRDAPLYTEEVVEVFLDPVGDGESYFEIEVNALNCVLDLVLRRNRSGYMKDIAWDCDGLRTMVRQTASAWSAELAIPFASLGAAPFPGARWRVNFTRIDRPLDLARELTAWSPTACGTFHAPARFGVLEFVD